MPLHEDDDVARLIIRLDGGSLWHQRPVYVELVHRALFAGLVGASVRHGFDAAGPGGRIGRAGPAHLVARGSCSVVIVDGEQRLREFLGTVQDVLEHARAAVVIDVVRNHRTARGGP
ncbi:DUF190 domain-containing protein [Streptomyces sp. T-3]|nr:DUF190 domain-containing protein [Streptomyces sp. T-3]